jgi:hypothetical protein
MAGMMVWHAYAGCRMLTAACVLLCPLAGLAAPGPLQHLLRPAVGLPWADISGSNKTRDVFCNVCSAPKSVLCYLTQRSPWLPGHQQDGGINFTLAPAITAMAVTIGNTSYGLKNSNTFGDWETIGGVQGVVYGT